MPGRDNHVEHNPGASQDRFAMITRLLEGVSHNALSNNVEP